jgi:putative toxin-antitoxin system antitoxin component (TIGR02293 family)
MHVIPFAFETSTSAPVSDSILTLFGSAEAARNPLQLVLLAQQGLSAGKALFVSKCLQLDANQMAGLLGITSKTFCTYQQEDRVLDATKSEQVLKLAQVVELGKEVFGDMESFNRWLQKPAYGLAGKLPIDLFYTSGGIDLVADELTRIAYGDLA